MRLLEPPFVRDRQHLSEGGADDLFVLHVWVDNVLGQSSCADLPAVSLTAKDQYIYIKIGSRPLVSRLQTPGSPRGLARHGQPLRVGLLRALSRLEFVERRSTFGGGPTGAQWPFGAVAFDIAIVSAWRRQHVGIYDSSEVPYSDTHDCGRLQPSYRGTSTRRLTPTLCFSTLNGRSHTCAP